VGRVSTAGAGRIAEHDTPDAFRAFTAYLAGGRTAWEAEVPGGALPAVSDELVLAASMGTRDAVALRRVELLALETGPVARTGGGSPACARARPLPPAALRGRR